MHGAESWHAATRTHPVVARDDDQDGEGREGGKGGGEGGNVKGNEL